MSSDSHKRDVGGVFRSADVPGPVFEAPIPYEEIKDLTSSAAFAALRELVKPVAAPVSAQPSS